MSTPTCTACGCAVGDRFRCLSNGQVGCVSCYRAANLSIAGPGPCCNCGATTDDQDAEGLFCHVADVAVGDRIQGESGTIVADAIDACDRMIRCHYVQSPEHHWHLPLERWLAWRATQRTWPAALQVWTHT